MYLNEYYSNFIIFVVSLRNILRQTNRTIAGGGKEGVEQFVDVRAMLTL